MRLRRLSDLFSVISMGRSPSTISAPTSLPLITAWRNSAPGSTFSSLPSRSAWLLIIFLISHLADLSARPPSLESDEASSRQSPEGPESCGD